MSAIKVGYWDIRGLVEPIHMYLSYKDIPYEKTSYTFQNMGKWGEDKQNLGIEFANIPYIIDGDVKMTQSNCILKYLELKYGSFCTGDAAHDIKLDMMLETVNDVRIPLLMVCVLGGDMETKKALFLPRLVSKLESLDERFQHKKYLTGDNLTVADFALWTAVDYISLFDAKLLESYKNIQRFKKDFEAEPKINAYLKSADYKQFPIFAPMAAWGGKNHAG